MGILSRFKKGGSCLVRIDEATNGLKKIAIVSSPNIGKSLMFNNLTRTHVTVSNYPGTTIMVSRDYLS